MEEKVKKILREYNQEHIIAWMDKVDNTTKEKIIKQVFSIDLEELRQLYFKVKQGVVKKDYEITPLKSTEKSKLGQNDEEEYCKLGEKVLKDNKFAVATMAGGQGTRLRSLWA